MSAWYHSSWMQRVICASAPDFPTKSASPRSHEVPAVLYRCANTPLGSGFLVRLEVVNHNMLACSYLKHGHFSGCQIMSPFQTIPSASKPLVSIKLGGRALSWRGPDWLLYLTRRRDGVSSYGYEICRTCIERKVRIV